MLKTSPPPPLSPSWTFSPSPIRISETCAYYQAYSVQRISCLAKQYLGPNASSDFRNEWYYLQLINEKRITRISGLIDQYVTTGSQGCCLILKNVGAPLSKNIGKMNAYSLLQVARDLLQALYGLRTLNLIHTNITAESVFIKEKANGTVHARLADFEKAELLHLTAESRRSRNSLPYWAPETFLGASITSHFDLWSVGVLLLEVYLGFNVFNAGYSPQDPSAIQATFQTISSVIGIPTVDFLQRCHQKNLYFTEDAGVIAFKKPPSFMASIPMMLEARRIFLRDDPHFTVQLCRLISSLLVYPNKRPDLQALLCSDIFSYLPLKMNSFKVIFSVEKIPPITNRQNPSYLDYLYDVRMPLTRDPFLTIDIHRTLDQEIIIPRSPTGFYEVQVRKKTDGSIVLPYSPQTIGRHPLISGKSLVIKG